jgi:hypothetical protein
MLATRQSPIQPPWLRPSPRLAQCHQPHTRLCTERPESTLTHAHTVTHAPQAIGEGGLYFDRYTARDDLSMPQLQQYYLRPDRAALMSLATLEAEAAKVRAWASDDALHSRSLVPTTLPAPTMMRRRPVCVLKP